MLFRFRLEAPDESGHFRQGTIDAESREAAEAFLMEREARFVAFSLPADRVADLADKDGNLPTPAPRDADESEKAAFRSLHVRTRAHLVAHHQSAPYVLVELEAIPDDGADDEAVED